MQMQGDDSKNKGWFYKQVIVYRDLAELYIAVLYYYYFFKN